MAVAQEKHREIKYSEAGLLLPKSYNWQVLHKQVHDAALNYQHSPSGRNFLYSVVDHSMLDDRCMVTIRTTEEFPENVPSSPKTLILTQDESITIRVDMSLQSSINFPSKKDRLAAKNKRLRVIANHELKEWIERVMMRRGFNVTEATWGEIYRRNVKKKNRHFHIPSTCFYLSGKVVDTKAFEEAWRNGVGRNKGYGFGMIEVVR